MSPASARLPRAPARSPYRPPRASRKRRRARLCAPERPRDLLGAEAHLRAIALWSAIVGGLLSLLAAPLVFAGEPTAVSATLAFGMLVFGAGHVAAGVGLWRYQEWGRISMIALNVIGAVLNLALPPASSGVSLVIGLAYAAAIAITLSTTDAIRVCTADYRARVQEHRASVRFHTSPFFWLPLASLALILIACGVLVVATASFQH
ncbi:MAG: hypothetical protein R3F62_02380 [Planctomycetota bacterium]